jgi:putative ABC transport system ATP-binding protein
VAQAQAALERLNVGHIAAQKPANCSVGEQQRASIARAILHNPKLILADEPTSALDDGNAEKVAQTLLQLATEQKAALLIVSHDSRLKSLISKTYAL